MKRIIWVFSISLLTFSCTNDTDSKTDPSITVQDGEARSKLSSGSTSEEELKAAAEARKEEQRARENEKLANQTTMEITPSVHDFGNIPKETPVSTIFKIKNTGDKPLIIDEAKASCGCTVPETPKDPIMPGDTYDLEVTFTSNKSQAGTSINKTVTISGNFPGNSKVVNIKGKVAS